eukprot:1134746-Pyramimonas_sp.AAC.1
MGFTVSRSWNGSRVPRAARRGAADGTAQRYRNLSRAPPASLTSATFQRDLPTAYPDSEAS